MSEQHKPTLLVAKGDMSRLGGAERDLLRVLPSLTNYYQVKLATLRTCDEMLEICKQNSVEVFTPNTPWQIPTGAFANIRDMIHKSSKLAWQSCDGLEDFLQKCNFFHIVSGDGYLAIIEMIPKNSPSHLHLLEPHRGLHEDSLHRKLDGKLKRPEIITNFFLRKARNNDLKIVREFYNRKHSVVSSNSHYSSSRAEEVYKIKSGVLHPCVDFNEFSVQQSPSKISPLDGEYVVTIGTAIWAKGTMEVIDMLNGTNISLVHVGGGTAQGKNEIDQHAKTNSVD